ncbi:MAG: prepilin-type N-terminal cleavage/methylation domain-containing protein [Candidatus Omnitrophica bacterium]|nr:prepilin-type N-terminal cleavage/methylation domain-containing protein [Candidatus Omnitrophota bacterium]
MKKQGFTLIELIVVIAIIAVLAAIIAPNAFKAVEKAKISATIEDFRSIKTACMSFYSDTGTWPSATGDGTPTATAGCSDSLTANTNCAAAPATITGWDGPYLEKWPATGRWGGGAYGYYRGTDGTAVVGSFNWDNTAATPDVRTISLTLVPTSAAQKMETQIDGTPTPATSDSNGTVRYAVGANTTVWYLISTD